MSHFFCSANLWTCHVYEQVTHHDVLWTPVPANGWCHAKKVWTLGRNGTVMSPGISRRRRYNYSPITYGLYLPSCYVITAVFWHYNTTFPPSTTPHARSPSLLHYNGVITTINHAINGDRGDWALPRTMPTITQPPRRALARCCARWAQQLPPIHLYFHLFLLLYL